MALSVSIFPLESASRLNTLLDGNQTASMEPHREGLEAEALCIAVWRMTTSLLSLWAPFLELFQQSIEEMLRWNTTGYKTRDVKAGGTPFLRLPLELMNMVLSQLSFTDRYFLSHTCSGLHNLLYRDWRWPVNKEMTKTDRFYFLARVAFHLPDQYACSKCARMHWLEPVPEEWDKEGQVVNNEYNDYDDDDHGDCDSDDSSMASDDSDDSEAECSTGFQGNYTRNFGPKHREHHLQVALKACNSAKGQGISSHIRRLPSLAHKWASWVTAFHEENHNLPKLHVSIRHEPSIKGAHLRLINKYQFAKQGDSFNPITFTDCEHIMFDLHMGLLQTWEREAGGVQKRAECLSAHQERSPWLAAVAELPKDSSNALHGRCNFCLDMGLRNRYKLWVDKEVVHMKVCRDYGHYWDVVKRDWYGRHHKIRWWF